MKMNKDYVLREVGGAYVIVAVGKSSKDYKRIITVNDSGAFIFKLLKNNASVIDIKLAMLKEYDIDAVQIEHDVNVFIEKLKASKIIE